ncbi:hypothetical protein PUN28_011110 [Cardiocondyla obscurior]|uniref:Uncharacterized protein n=1 Tax=Cardiocondyla obscurior TaxID=286306 RepID=A0AAW2FJ94_9HYME
MLPHTCNIKRRDEKRKDALTQGLFYKIYNRETKYFASESLILHRNILSCFIITNHKNSDSMKNPLSVVQDQYRLFQRQYWNHYILLVLIP